MSLEVSLQVSDSVALPRGYHFYFIPSPAPVLAAEPPYSTPSRV